MAKAKTKTKPIASCRVIQLSPKQYELVNDDKGLDGALRLEKDEWVYWNFPALEAV